MDWIRLVIALIETGIGLVPLNLQVPLEIPTTVIGLIGLVVAILAYGNYYLLKQNSELSAQLTEIASEYAKGSTVIANSLQEVTVAVKQGRDYDTLNTTLTRKIDELYIQIQTTDAKRTAGAN